jgi:hypothetical protein
MAARSQHCDVDLFFALQGKLDIVTQSIPEMFFHCQYIADKLNVGGLSPTAAFPYGKPRRALVGETQQALEK